MEATPGRVHLQRADVQRVHRGRRLGLAVPLRLQKQQRPDRRLQHSFFYLVSRPVHRLHGALHLQARILRRVHQFLQVKLHRPEILSAPGPRAPHRRHAPRLHARLEAILPSRHLCLRCLRCDCGLAPTLHEDPPQHPLHSQCGHRDRHSDHLLGLQPADHGEPKQIKSIQQSSTFDRRHLTTGLRAVQRGRHHLGNHLHVQRREGIS